jgi:hypothetical protein
VLVFPPTVHENILGFALIAAFIALVFALKSLTPPASCRR